MPPFYRKQKRFFRKMTTNDNKFEGHMNHLTNYI